MNKVLIRKERKTGMATVFFLWFGRRKTDDLSTRYTTQIIHYMKYIER